MPSSTKHKRRPRPPHYNILQNKNSIQKIIVNKSVYTQDKCAVSINIYKNQCYMNYIKYKRTQKRYSNTPDKTYLDY